MLDHRYKSEQPRTMEELSKYAFPSAPNESFQSILLGKIPVLGFNKPAKDLPIDFCELLISMWAKCVEEKYVCSASILLDLAKSSIVCANTSFHRYVDTCVGNEDDLDCAIYH
jgi:hypothetical protein